MENNIKILFASNNKGKYDELVNDFKKCGIDLLFYKDIQDKELVLEETSEILAVNAREKARQAAEQTGYMSLGDDSGVYVRALDYFPGVHSRRWSFDEKDDNSRNRMLLDLMKDEYDRRVYLISRFSLVDESGNEIFKTVVKNKFNLAYDIFGDKGFGYDPVLIPDAELINKDCKKRLCLNEREYDELIMGFQLGDITIGCLPQQEKNSINNRGRIAEEIKSVFKDYYERKSEN